MGPWEVNIPRISEYINQGKETRELKLTDKVKFF